jgi:hypothetical protein
VRAPVLGDWIDMRLSITDDRPIVNHK